MDIKQIIDFLGLKEQEKIILEILKNVQGKEFDSILNNAKNGQTSEDLYKQLKTLAEKKNIHEDTLGLVAIISLAEMTHKDFLDKNCSEFFIGAIEDVKHKIVESREWHSVFGMHSFEWVADFFCFKMFAMGRLEFNVIEQTEYEYNGIVKIKKGDRVLNVHIPSGSKLDIEQCYRSLQQAFDYFKDVRINGYLPVLLTNWFLYPPFEKLFSPNGNLTKFKNLFDVIGSENYSDYQRISKRVFNTLDYSNIDSLPQNTSLQKNFTEWFKEGKLCGYGIGYLLFDGQKVVTGK